MQITVIVCTYNRSGLLPQALESIAASDMPPGIQWEILVTDNNSSDSTRSVIEEFIRRYPGRFRYLFECRPGKSNALNAAIADSNGQVLAFVDDDVTVHPQWLYRLTAPLFNGNWTGAGGRVLAGWDSAIPAWLDQESWIAAGPLVQFDRGLQPGPLRETPVGTNMAFRRSIFDRYGGFRTDLGPRPGSEIRNEDSEFTRRLLNAGECLYYEPQAIVYHPVPENRLRKRYFLAWWFDKGRSEIRETADCMTSGWSIARVPLPHIRRIIRWSIQSICTPDPRRRFISRVCLWKLLGEIAEFRNISAFRELRSYSSTGLIPESYGSPTVSLPSMDAQNALSSASSNHLKSE